MFWVFGMTRSGIEPQSPGPLAKVLEIKFILRNPHKVLLGRGEMLVFVQKFCSVVFSQVVHDMW